MSSLFVLDVEDDDIQEIPVETEFFFESYDGDGGDGGDIQYLTFGGVPDVEEEEGAVVYPPPGTTCASDPLQDLDPPVDQLPPLPDPPPIIVVLDQEEVAKAPAVPIPPKYASMKLPEFTAEMQENIYDIIWESVTLFSKDPREYHPFYLRVYKYLTIGQQLGFVESENVKNLWEAFSNFAKEEFEMSKKREMPYAGERSPYATFLLTRKVVIDGKVMPPKGGGLERQRLFRRLEGVVNRIRAEWRLTGRPEEEMREDLKIRLKFFEECKTVSYPSDCAKMNNLWSKFLGEKSGKRRDSPSKAGKIVKVEENKKVDSKESLRRIICRVIVKSSVSPAHSPPASPCAPSPPGSPLPPKKTKRKKPCLPVESATPSKNLEKKSEVVQMSAREQILMKRQLSHKIRQSLVNKSGTVLQRKVPVLSSTGALKQKPFCGPISKIKKIGTKKVDIERQLRLEKFINQTNRKLLLTPAKKKTSLVKISSPVKKEETPKIPENTTDKKTQISTKLEKKRGGGILKKLADKRKKKKEILQNRKKKKVSFSDKSSKSSDGRAGKTKDRWYAYFSKYEKTPGACPVCLKPVLLGNLSLHIRKVHKITEDGDLFRCSICQTTRVSKRIGWLCHLEMQHGDLVHMDDMLEVAQQLNTKENLDQERFREMISHLPGPTTQKRSRIPKFTRFRAPSKGPLIPPFSAGVPGADVQCSACQGWFPSNYIDTHRALLHNPNQHLGKCPACPKVFPDRRSSWYHYCVHHLDGSQQQIFDPVKMHGNLEDLFNPPGPQQREKFKRRPKEYEDNSTFCDICGKNFGYSQNMRRHMDQVHAAEVQKYTCEYCAKEFKSQDWLKFHIRQKHDGTVKGTCTHCGKDLQTPGKLWRHLIDNHGISSSEAAAYCEVTFVLCLYCGQEVLEGRQYRNHVKNNHPEKNEEFLVLENEREKIYVPRDPALRKKYPGIPKDSEGYSIRCLDKNERRKLKKREERRIMRETGIGPAWLKKEGPDKGHCEECQEFIPKGFRLHRRRVHGIEHEGLVTCGIDGCTNQFTNVRYLRGHMRARHSTRLEEEIVAKKVVKVLEKSATGLVLQCQLCTEYLFHLEEVKVHFVALHQNLFKDWFKKEKEVEEVPVEVPEKKVQCPYCPEVFGGEEDARGHVEGSHGDVCWRCPECGKVVLDPEDLGRHFVTDHQEGGDGGDVGGKEKEAEKEEEEEEEDEGNWLTITIKGGVNHSSSSRIRQKYRSMPVTCPICGRKLCLGRLHTHLKETHGVKEDGVFKCTWCQPERVYQSKSRVDWLKHSDTQHQELINFQELFEEASKIATTGDWRTQDIKNNKPYEKKKKRNKSENESEEDSEEESESEEEKPPRKSRRSGGAISGGRRKVGVMGGNKAKGKVVKKKVPDPPPRSQGTRNLRNKTRPKYNLDSDDDAFKEDSDGVSGSVYKRNFKTGGRDRGVKRRARETQVPGDIEKKKRLVIKLVKLTDQELEQHLNKSKMSATVKVENA